jgi:class 3 adenylate cyclase
LHVRAIGVRKHRPGTLTCVQSDVLLIIADISGYTRFMVANETELEHSHQIISALLEAIVAQAEIPLSLAKLEGDAAFLYAIKEPGIAERVGARLGRFFAAFSSRLAELAVSRPCQCGACRNINRLRLKMIVHSGRAIVVEIAGRTELAGVDVIILHRLLKNSVPWNEYIVLTEAAARDLRLELPIVGSLTERYDEIGSVNVIVYKPVVGLG